MRKANKKIVHKKKAVPVLKNKKIIKRPKAPQEKVLKINRLSETDVEKKSLLNENQIRTSLKYLVGWKSTDNNKMIYREYILLNFTAAVDLIDRIAKIAEDEKHHPDIHLTQYRNLRVGTTTHELGGLTRNDFNVATRINELPMELKHA